MKRKLVILVGILAAAAVVTTLVFFRGDRYVFTLTQGQIEDGLDARFPVEKSHLGFLDVRYHDPRVELRAGEDRIGVQLSATLNLRLSGQPRPLSGTVLVRTGLRYDPQIATFFLDDPWVEELEIQGIPLKHVDRVNEIARKLAREHIHRIAVYDLRKKPDLKHAAARLILKGFVVEDGRVVVTLGL